MVGIGVNCDSHPADTDFPATDLAAAGADVSAEALFAALSAKMHGRLAQWNEGGHFATIRTDWLARAAGLGELIRVRLPTARSAGSFETLDDAGRLVVPLPDGAVRRSRPATSWSSAGACATGGGERDGGAAATNSSSRRSAGWARSA